MKIRSRFLTKLLAWLVVGLMRLLFCTCRKVVVTEEPGTAYDGNGERRFVYSVWHDQIMLAIFSGRVRRMTTLVSRHQDGSILTDALHAVGIKAVRGSSSRGGAAAMRELLEATRDYHITITPDGPRGPRREAKSGIVYLASRAERQIAAAAHTCKRSWRIQGSWTDMLLPRPFTTVYLYLGSPIDIPSGLTREEIRDYTRRIEDEMQRVERLVQRLAAGESPDDLVEQTVPDEAERRAA